MPSKPQSPENYFDIKNLQNADKRRLEIVEELTCYKEMLSDVIKRLEDNDFFEDEYKLYVIDTVEAVHQRIETTIAKVKRNIPYIQAKVLLNKIMD